MPKIPTGEWLPDLPAFENPGAITATNCLPRTQMSYGPMLSLVPRNSGIANRCLGAITARDTAGNVSVFAGDSGSLYQTGTGAGAFSNVSKAGGYTLAVPERWSLAQFGSAVVACNIANKIQSYTLQSSSLFADIGSGAPQARYCASVRDWLVVGNTFDSINGLKPQRVWWSAIDDPTNWPTPGTTAAAQVQSDFQDVAGTHGWLQGIVAGLGNADAVLFFERAVYRMTYVGPPAIFSILPAEGARGTPAPGSIAVNGPIVFYYGQDGFYQFDGAVSQPIGFGKVDAFFQADTDQTSLNYLVSAVDPVNRLYLVAYPRIGSPTTSCNRMLAFHWPTQRWSYITGLNLEWIIPSAAFGVGLDQLNAIYPAGLDTIPFSLDSRAFTNGAIQLAAFDATHSLAYFAGQTLAATIDTTEFQAIPNRRARITSALPLIDGGTPTISIGARNRTVDASTFGAAIPLNAQGFFPIDAEGRYLRARIQTNAGDAWTHIQGIDVPDDAVTDSGFQ